MLLFMIVLLDLVKSLDSAAFGITWLPALSNFLPLHVKETIWDINTEKLPLEPVHVIITRRLFKKNLSIEVLSGRPHFSWFLTRTS